MIWLWWLLAIGLACAIWGIGIERYLFTVREEQIKALPKGSSPIRVLHISDLHFAPWQKRKAKFVRSLAKLNPDLVVNTGDNLGHKNAIPFALEALDPLSKFAGVFVNGSNDYHAPHFRNPLSYLFKPSDPTHMNPLETEKLVSTFEQRGWHNLNNRSATLNVGQLKFGFLGLDDPHDDLADISTLEAQAKAVAGSQVIVGVAHAPYMHVLESFAFNGASVAFAGHTHGGQVCLPLKGALATNCDLPTKYAKGISAWKFGSYSLVLNVCAGLGTSIFAPARFFCRPEVRLITLLPQD